MLRAEVPARVIESFGRRVIVETADGRSACPRSCSASD